MYEPNAHVCGVDCERVDMDGHVSHVMYPSEPNSAAGRYQAALNLGMTRREYRASGQDESRECRVWAMARAERIARNERIDNSRRNWGLI
jgi:hypothetical protein